MFFFLGTPGDVIVELKNQRCVNIFLIDAYIYILCVFAYLHYYSKNWQHTTWYYTHRVCIRCIYDISLTRLICVSNLCSGSRFDILMLPRLWGRGPWKPRWHEFCKHAAWLNCFTPKLGLRMVGDVWEDDGKALDTWFWMILICESFIFTMAPV